MSERVAEQYRLAHSLRRLGQAKPENSGDPSVANITQQPRIVEGWETNEEIRRMKAESGVKYIGRSRY